MNREQIYDGGRIEMCMLTITSQILKYEISRQIKNINRSTVAWLYEKWDLEVFPDILKVKLEV